MDSRESAALERRPQVMTSLESSYNRRPQCWQNISKTDWDSWQWQWRNRLFTADDIARAIDLAPDEIRAIREVASIFSAAVSPHYVSLIRRELGQNCPIRKQCIPSLLELEQHRELLKDPLGEYRHAITSCSFRRYPDRMLIYTTHECAMRCRHCTRRSRVGLNEQISNEAIADAIRHIRENENIRDVLISGGDPLSLDNRTIGWILTELHSILHIDVIRLCTRMPCTLPQRLNDPELLDILQQNAPIYVNTQFNHPLEMTIESAAALKNLRMAGCILGNQSVLLKGINDDGCTIEMLNRALLREGCRPYYLFLCDVAQGTQHFRTSIQCGLDIMQHLRGRVSGLAIPHFVIDLPDGYGKVDLCLPPIQSAKDGTMHIRNGFGADVEYRDPE